MEWTKVGFLFPGQFITLTLEPGVYEVRVKANDDWDKDSEETKVNITSQSVVKLDTYAWMSREELYVTIDLKTE